MGGNISQEYYLVIEAQWRAVTEQEGGILVVWSLHYLPLSALFIGYSSIFLHSENMYVRLFGDSNITLNMFMCIRLAKQLQDFAAPPLAH